VAELAEWQSGRVAEWKRGRVGEVEGASFRMAAVRERERFVVTAAAAGVAA
jgi:hypothetical protein